MFVIYENATKNDDPLPKTFCFDAPTDLEYDGIKYENKKLINLFVKKGKTVRATRHPHLITTRGYANDYI
ncbi:hypothetical protein VPDG_00018 [Vibrio phage henriette 12B8]|uniref:hypothetical protein n=1 Tax=Vibrio phage henriette 12B8 TaxID=573174 RepID=UPI0002C12C44|nr:hypothetical protein VPDG_00018 [Vibrio phage henriette 12B8]AGG58180.1 hypothetical protein VPDG_00018 [Vibrio phage henriette 12B8]